MPLDQDLIDLMLDTVRLELVTDVDKYNKFVYSAPVDVRCAIFKMNKQVLDRGGRETTSTLQAILADPTLDVTPDTRLTMPDGSHPDIIEVLSAKDDVGPYYLEIRA